DQAIDAMKKLLIPLAKVITPNIPEAEVLTGIVVHNLEDRRRAAQQLHQLGARVVVVKGGHDEAEADILDLIYDGVQFTELYGKRFSTKNTHGTGCTFSAAIAAELAKGTNVIDAIRTAQRFVQAAIA